MNSLADALYDMYIVASSIALVVFLAQWVLHLAMIRMEILLTRKGHWEDFFGVIRYEKSNIGYIIYYIPAVMYNGVFSFLLLTALLWLILVIFAWDITRSCMYILDCIIVMHAVPSAIPALSDVARAAGTSSLVGMTGGL